MLNTAHTKAAVVRPPTIQLNQTLEHVSPRSLHIRVGNAAPPRASATRPTPRIADNAHIDAATINAAMTGLDLLDCAMDSPQMHTALSLLRGGIAGVDAAQLPTALSMLHRPLGAVLADVLGGDQAAALAPWLLACLLQEMFVITPEQGVALTDVIRRHAATLSISQWITALSQPRHERRGALALQALATQEQQDALARTLDTCAARNAPRPSGLSTVAAALPALAAAAVVSTVAPPLAIPAALVGGAGFLGILSRDLSASTQDSAAHDSAAAEQADAVLATLLPAWSPKHRADLFALWSSHPNHWSLLDAAQAAQDHLSRTRDRVPDALNALRKQSASPSGASHTHVSAADALLALCQLLHSRALHSDAATGASLPPHHATPAHRRMDQADLAAGTDPRIGLRHIAERNARQDHLQRLQQRLDAPRMPLTRALDQRELKIRTRLMMARFTQDPVERTRRVREEHDRLDSLINPIGHASAARAGDVKGAMQADVQAARAGMALHSRSRACVAADVHQGSRTSDDTTTSQGASNAPTWLTRLLPWATGAATASAVVNIEMTPLNTRAERTQAADATDAASVLLPPAARVATGSAGRVRRLINRNPVIATAAAVTTGAGLAAAGATALYNAITKGLSGGSSPQAALTTPSMSPPLTGTPDATIEEINTLFNTEVTLPDGSWGTAADQRYGLLPSPDRGTRQRRDTRSASASTHRPAINLTDGAGNAMSARHPTAADIAHSQHAVALLTADTIAASRGEAWHWLKDGAESEKVLWVSQLHALNATVETLQPLVEMPRTLMAASLHAAEWPIGQPWEDITITLPREPGTDTATARLTRMATPDDTLTLMEFRTSRDTVVPPTATFARAGVPLDAHQATRLRNALNSAQCRSLAERLDRAFSEHRDTIVQARLQRLKLDATTAKMQGELGRGERYHRGAEIVMGFFSGRQDIEFATPVYTDMLPDGQSISVPLHNHLLLRARTPGDEVLNGQLVLYRTDTGTFNHFEDSDAFHQFLNERTARQHPLSHADQFAVDILRAAPQRHEAALRSLLTRRAQGGEMVWDAYRNLRIDFRRATASIPEPRYWCAELVSFEERLRRTDVTIARLRNSPLGTANAALQQELDTRTRRDVQSHLEYARSIASPELSSTIGRDGLDTDLIQMRCNGIKATLTEWMMSLWHEHGIKRPADFMAADFQHGLGGGSGEPWPSPKELGDIQLTAVRIDANGARVQDDAAQQALNARKRDVFAFLQTYGASQSLMKDYKAYLRNLQNTPRGRDFIENSIDAAKVRMQWMIESAFIKGAIDQTTRDALLTAHRHVGAHASPHERVQLNGHVIHGLWAIKTPQTHQIFIMDGPHGDEILTERTFQQWLLTPEAEGFIARHSGYRYHNLLAGAFGAKHASSGLSVSFTPSHGLWPDTLDSINRRIENIHEKFPTGENAVWDTLKVVGTIATAITCAAVPFPPAVIACVGGTLALLPVAVIDGLDMLDRGDLNGAIGEIGGGVVSILDPFDATKLVPLLYRVGKNILRTPDDVADALRLATWQNAGFDSKGVLTDVYATTSHSSSPSIVTSLPEKALRITQDDIDYVQTASGALVRVHVDDTTGVIRVHASDAPDKPGAPIHDVNGEWVLQHAPSRIPHVHLHTHEEETVLLGAIPRARALSGEKQREISSLFGAGSRLSHASPDLEHVIDVELMRQRIDMMTQAPDSIGLPGDEAVLLRAWSDSRALGGRQIRILVDEGGDLGPRIVATFGEYTRFTQDLMTDDEVLPSLAWLVDQSDPSQLAVRLGMSPAPDRRTLLAAVKRELSHVIARDRSQSLKTWIHWKNLPPPSTVASDNLHLHYPTLTVAEADYIMLTASDQHRSLVEQWSFPDAIHQRATWMVAARSERTQRQEIIDGVLRTRGAAKNLIDHLQAVVPARRWNLAPESEDGIAITFPHRDDLTGKERIVFSADGHVSTPDGTTRRSTWQDAIAPQLTRQETALLGDSAALHRRVSEHMRHVPLPSMCTLMARPRHRIRRVVPDTATSTCAPIAIGISLTQEDLHVKRLSTETVEAGRALIDARNQELQDPIDHIHRLQKIKASKRTPEQLRVIATLPHLTPPDSGLRSANLAHYTAKDMTFQGKTIAFPSGEHRFALSGDRKAFTNEFIENVPVRITYEVDDGSNGARKNVYRNSYPFGASVARLENKPKVLFSAEDLTVMTGSERKPTLMEDLPPDMASSLALEDYSTRLQKLLKEDQPALPENLHVLKHDTPYVESQIRACSESKIIQDLVNAILVHDSTITTRINNDDPIKDLSGALVITSELSPCATSCDDRLRSMIRKFDASHFDLKFYYFYHDNNDRSKTLTDNKKKERARSQGLGPGPAPLVSRLWDPSARC